MSLMAITGNLGAGKTLTGVYYGARNFFLKDKTVFSNFPITFIDDLGDVIGKSVMIDDPSDIADLEDGVFIGDELWSWLDARQFGKKSNQILAKILLTSRKKNVHIFYTSQTIEQMDKRVRDITDFEAVPSLFSHKTKCKVIVYQLLRGKRQCIAKTFIFKTPLVYPMYDTNYIIETKNIGD